MFEIAPHLSDIELEKTLDALREFITSLHTEYLEDPDPLWDDLQAVKTGEQCSGLAERFLRLAETMKYAGLDNPLGETKPLSVARELLTLALNASRQNFADSIEYISKKQSMLADAEIELRKICNEFQDVARNTKIKPYAYKLRKHWEELGLKEAEVAHWHERYETGLDPNHKGFLGLCLNVSPREFRQQQIELRKRSATPQESISSSPASVVVAKVTEPTIHATLATKETRRRPPKKTVDVIVSAIRNEGKAVPLLRLVRLTNYKKGTLKHYLGSMVKDGIIYPTDRGYALKGKA